MKLTPSTPVNAAVQFDNYVVRRIELEVPDPWLAEGPAQLDLDIKERYAISEDRSHARVSLACAVVAVRGADSTGLRLAIELEGFFTVKDTSGPADLVDQVLHQNTLAILFPYLRAAMTTITCAANIPPIVLPVMNVVEMLKNKSSLQHATESPQAPSDPK